MADKEIIKCSFCDKDKQDTNVLIAGINAHICDSCIDQAIGIVEAEKSGKDASELSEHFKLLKPKEIKIHLKYDLRFLKWPKIKQLEIMNLQWKHFFNWSRRRSDYQ